MRGNILRLLEWLALGLMVYLTNQTIFVWFMEYNWYGGSPQLQLVLWVLLLMFVFFWMRLRHEEKAYFTGWGKNWLVGLFLLLAFSSLFWSVSFPATLYRVLLAIFVALIGAYLGLRFSARNLVLYLAISIGVLALASLFLALVFPKVGIHPYAPYLGLWRGVFWHKIYLGATLAIGYLAGLVILFSSQRQYSLLQKFFAAGLVVLCAALAILSDSASGLMVFVIQTGLLGVVLAWIKWGHLLSRRMYGLLAGLALTLALLILTQLEFIFGLFNRSVSMTGRVPMWEHLSKTYIVKHPWLGHGFGAFWMQPGIMQKVQAIVRWGNPVRVSDNGYLDLWLGVGAVGLLLFLMILGLGFWHAFPRALQGRDLTSFFPLLLLVHILLINLSLSYLFENETFIWFLLVVVVFMSSRPESEPQLVENLGVLPISSVLDGK